MPSMLRPLTKMFAAWMVVGSGALAGMALFMGEAPKKPVVIAAETPLPCRLQAWPMIDRKCLTWTAPPKSDAAVEAPARAAPIVAALATKADTETAAPEAPEAAPTAKPQPVEPEVAAEPEIAAEPEPPALRPSLASERIPAATPRSAHRPAPAPRIPAPGEILVTARSATGTRTIVIRPTTPQDALYYAARRDVASFGPYGLRR